MGRALAGNDTKRAAPEDFDPVRAASRQQTQACRNQNAVATQGIGPSPTGPGQVSSDISGWIF